MPNTAEDADTELAVDGWMNARERLIYGWLVDLQDPRCKRSVEISVDGMSVGFACADRYHEGVHAKHGGDGLYRFCFYYDGPIEDGTLGVAAHEAKSRTPLRTKGPQSVTQSKRAGPPLAINRLRLGEKMELLGRIGAYPANSVELELWHGSEGSKNVFPVSPLRKGGEFSAEIPSDLIQDLLSAEAELALPGMKEAGVAVPLRDLVFASVAYREGTISIELSDSIEVGEGAPLTVRFLRSDLPTSELPITPVSNKATISAPNDFVFSEETFEVLVGNAPLRLQIQHELLRDLSFQSLGNSESSWQLSDGATGERSFFAFPKSLSHHLGLRGDIARVANSSGSQSFRLYQRLGSRGEPISAVVRASHGAKLVARLADQTGVLCEEGTTAQGDSSWHVFKLESEAIDAVVGELFFEIEASGEDVRTMEVAIGTSHQTSVPAEPDVDNLLSNPKLELWPDGVGVREHTLRGEIAQGWRFLNKGCTTPVWTRAVLHPSDGVFGLAIAAPEVPKWLRVETDFRSATLSERMLIRFRAGIPATARQLLAYQKSPVPEFALISSISIVRRTVIAAGSSFDVHEEVIAQTTRKIAISSEVETFELPLTVDLHRKNKDQFEGGVNTYHLAFGFSGPAVTALFDVKVVPQTENLVDVRPPNLKLEDTAIELQVSKLVGLETWVSNAARGAPVQHTNRSPLKWSVAAAREPVEIILPVYNAIKETLACLESLAASTRVPLLVRIIDDGSEEPVRTALQNYTRDKPWVELHRLDRNHGYTYAADFGIRLAQTEWVVLLNSDTIATQGWLEGLLACARSDPKIAFAGPLSNAATFQSVPELYSASGKWKVNPLPAGMSAEDMADMVRSVSLNAYPEVPLLNGFCTLMRRSVFLELGGLNTAAFPAGYGEENDLCLRASKAGYKLAVADDVYVYHVKSASFGHARRDKLSKGGNAVLRRLHPDVDINTLAMRFRDTVPLVAIRQRLIRELTRPTGNDVGTADTSQHEPLEATVVEQTLTRENQKA